MVTYFPKRMAIYSKRPPEFKSEHLGKWGKDQNQAEK
jgi:hypothetical protein